MAQFDVHELASGTLVVDVQTDVLARLVTRRAQETVADTACATDL